MQNFPPGLSSLRGLELEPKKHSTGVCIYSPSRIWPKLRELFGGGRALYERHAVLCTNTDIPAILSLGLACLMQGLSQPACRFTRSGNSENISNTDPCCPLCKDAAQKTTWLLLSCVCMGVPSLTLSNLGTRKKPTRINRQLSHLGGLTDHIKKGNTCAPCLWAGKYHDTLTGTFLEEEAVPHSSQLRHLAGSKGLPPMSTITRRSYFLLSTC